jgi:hypothetical protein
MVKGVAVWPAFTLPDLIGTAVNAIDEIDGVHHPGPPLWVGMALA